MGDGMFGGACICDIEGDYSPEVLHLRQQTARKRYRCLECRHHIQPGDPYFYGSELADGKWGHWRTCRVCVAVMRDFSCYSYLFDILTFLQESDWAETGERADWLDPGPCQCRECKEVLSAG